MDLSRILRGGCHLWLSETWPTFSILSMKLTAKTQNSFQHTFRKDSLTRYPMACHCNQLIFLLLSVTHRFGFGGNWSVTNEIFWYARWFPCPFKVQNGIFGIWKVTWSPRCAAQLPGITWNSGVTRQNFNGQSSDYMKRSAKSATDAGILLPFWSYQLKSLQIIVTMLFRLFNCLWLYNNFWSCHSQ